MIQVLWMFLGRTPHIFHKFWMASKIIVFHFPSSFVTRCYNFKIICSVGCIEDITRRHDYISYIFEWLKQYFTSYHDIIKVTLCGQWWRICVVFLKAKAVLKFVESISEKTLRSTVSLTAARGRGKSAALGLAISTAIAFGWVQFIISNLYGLQLILKFFICKETFEALFKCFCLIKAKTNENNNNKNRNNNNNNNNNKTSVYRR